LLDCIKNGFRIRKENVQLLQNEVGNYKSATDLQTKHNVEYQTLIELKEGKCIATQTTPIIVSAIGVTLKLNSEKARLIIDCSRPQTLSVNMYR